MLKPDKETVIAMVQALEELSEPDNKIGVKGLKFMCKEAASMIRRLNPDIAIPYWKED